MVESRQEDLIADLQTLNFISETLNQSTDVQGALNSSLARLVELMGLETGWIFLRDETAMDRWAGRGFRLVAYHNLPPAINVANPQTWDTGCDCQTLCLKGKLDEAYNEVHCSRLARVSGDRLGLNVHASAPLRSRGIVLGILNVAAPDWSSFTPRSLSLLTNVGSQMGIALERARLFDLVQEQRIHEQAALLDLSNQLLSRRDLDDLMEYIVNEVRALLRADACSLLMPDEDLQTLRFYAASGWRADPVQHGNHIPLDDSTASGRVMYTQQALVVDDLEAYYATAVPSAPGELLQWLREERFCSVAIVPLIADGLSIGTLAIDSRRPRRFNETELRLLRLMANQASIAIEQARLQKEEIRRQRIEEELAVGRNIQLSMLPDSYPALDGWDFAARYEAARQVGGDFYDFFALPGEPGRWGIVIADVSDKGVPAALFMALSRTTIRNVALRGRPPAEVLTWANRFIQEDSQAHMFLTAFYGELDSRHGSLVYANAGHNPPLLWQASTKRFIDLNANGVALGVLEQIEMEERVIVLEPGDLTVLYTDGVTEAINIDQEEFGETRLKDVLARKLRETSDASADDILSAILAAVVEFTGNVPQYDDMTLFVIKHTHDVMSGEVNGER
jgi:sigma-B regulation protein RsbU (phosphoserine phosphatase)